MSLTRRAVLAMSAVVAVGAARAAETVILLGTTTTTENSGLLAHIAPKFSAETGIELRAIVAGTGKILKLAERGDVDVTLTHFPAGEADLVARGITLERHEVMHNDFLIVGPSDDPAGAAGAASAADALARIAAHGGAFVSRGDESGTHRKERSLWPAAPAPGLNAPPWYRETGAGMGATLNVAAATGAYTLVDRGSWAAFANRGPLAPLFEGDPALANPYAAMRPAPAGRAHLNHEGAAAFIAWLSSNRGRDAIASFRIGGEQVFFPVD